MNLSSLSSLPTRSKLVLGACAAGVVLFAFLMLRLAGAPSYTTMMSGLDPAQTGKITAALDAENIGYELQANGTALAVNKADASRARVTMAEQGLATSGSSSPGFELFDSQKLGASDFQQKVTYQRALEGEIAKNLNGVEGITGARVQLVMPEEDLFADASSAATAAVSLGNPADTLEPGAIRGMAQLVSSSVKDLKPANVTITDSSGQLLWPAEGATGTGAGDSTKQAAEARYATQLESSINAMLSRTVGDGKAMVEVQADLNMDRTHRNSLVYAKKGVPLTAETEKEKLRGTGGSRAGGTSGAAGNVTTYTGGGTGSGNSNYNRTSTKTTRAVNKTVSETDVAPGAVNRLSVALVLDKSVPANAMKGIQSTVSSAAGLDVARGDTITTTRFAFAKAPEPATTDGPVPASILGYGKWVGLGLAALLFCFFMMRHLRRREADSLPQPAWLREIDQPVSLAALESGFDAPTRVMAAPLPDRAVDPSQQRLEQLMDREPERVAAQVRQWMDED